MIDFKTLKAQVEDDMSRTDACETGTRRTVSLH